MKVDLYLEGCRTAIRVLVPTLQNPRYILTKDEQLDLEQFIADLRSALDEEAERDWYDRQQP
jgi:hypothetical protein